MFVARARELIADGVQFNPSLKTLREIKIPLR
jgi:hypothetical protein